MSEPPSFGIALREVAALSIWPGLGLFCLAVLGASLWIVPLVAQAWLYHLLSQRVARELAGDELPRAQFLPLASLYLFAGTLTVVLSYFLLLSTANLMLGAIVMGIGVAQTIGATWFAPRAVELLSGMVWASGAGFARRSVLALAAFSPIAVILAAASYRVMFTPDLQSSGNIWAMALLMVPSFFAVFYAAPVIVFAATYAFCRYERASAFDPAMEPRDG